MARYVNIEAECSVIDNIKNNYEIMYGAEAKVADFILGDPEKALESNVSETAEHSGVSDATVVRFCKRLGYTGFYQLRLQLSHDFGKNRQLSSKGDIGKTGTAQDMMQAISDFISAMAQKIDSETVKRCAEAINKCDSVYVIGRGYSKILASDILFRLSRLGFRTLGGNFAETDIECVCHGTGKDVLICVSHSGETKRIIQALEIAKLKGMTTIALTDSEKNPLSQNADYALSSGIWNGRELDSENSHLYMIAIIDTMLNFVAKRQNDTSYIENVLVESRI